MTARPDPQTPAANSPLQVVPPNQTPPQASDRPATAPPTPSEPDAKPDRSRRWAIVGATAIGLGVLGFVPLPNYVTGEATIESRENERQKVTVPPEAGIVHLKVRQNDRVRPGDVVAEIENRELEDRLAEVERSLQQEQSNLRIARQELDVAQAQLSAAEWETANAERRLDRHRSDTAALTAGTGLPQSRQVERQMEGMTYEIAGYQDEVARLEREISEIEARQQALSGELNLLYRDVDTAQASLDNLNTLVSEGGLARDGILINERRNRLSDLQRQVVQKEGERQQNAARIAQIQQQIARTRNQASQVERQVAARGEQIEEVQWQFDRDELDVRDRYESRMAARMSVSEEVEAAALRVQTHEAAIDALDEQLSELQARKDSLTLRATTPGTVFTQGLDLRDGSYLNAGEEILSIVDLDNLDAKVQVDQGDKNLVDVGQPGQFRTPNQGSIRYAARVEEIQPKIDSDTPGAKPVLEVTLRMDNRDGFLSPGQTGHVHIRTENRNLYQKVRHQFGKLVDLPRYFPWLSSGTDA